MRHVSECFFEVECADRARSNGKNAATGSTAPPYSVTRTSPDEAREFGLRLISRDRSLPGVSQAYDRFFAEGTLRKHVSCLHVLSQRQADNSLLPPYP
jgi:hypothetical protein